MPGADGGRPRSTRAAPRAATIAPLSVHRCGGWHPHIQTLGTFGQHHTQSRVSRNPTADDKRADAGIATGSQGFGHEHIHHGLLEGRRNISGRDRIACATLHLKPTHDGCLEAGEGEVVAMILVVTMRGERAGKINSSGIAGTGRSINMRSTRKGQPEHASHLVEGFSRSIADPRQNTRQVEGQRGRCPKHGQGPAVS